MEFNYSIIIPHHNIPDLLRRCLDSIPTRDDLEVIVVDDASKEQYKPLLRDVCAAHSHKHLQLVELAKNGGGGRARNEGLSVAKGKFVLFADADDFFNYCINNILDEYIETDADIVFFKGSCVDSETYITGTRLNYINQKIERYLADPIKGETTLRYHFQIPVCKIIRHSVITEHNLSFDETSIRNDVTFSYRLGHAANRLKVDNRALYCATTREGSVSTFRDADKILTTIDVLGRAVMFFRSIGRNDESYETSLSHNLYILLKRKDFDNFNLGFSHLETIGFNRHDAEQMFSLRIAETALSSCIWCIRYAPSNIIKRYCLKYFYKSFVK